MSIVDRLKQTVEAKKESYEASAAMILCLVIAICFLLVGGAIWFADYVGPVWSCMSFCGAFLFLTAVFWLFGHVKSKDADQNIDAAKQTVAGTVRVATKTVETLTSNTKQLTTVDAILAGGLLLVLLYLGGRRAIPDRESLGS